MALSGTYNQPYGGDDWANMVLHSRDEQTGGRTNRDAVFGAAGLDPGGRYEGNIAAARLLPGEFQLAARQQGLALELQPQQQAAMRQYVNLLQHPELMSQQYHDQVMGQMREHLPEIWNGLQSSGAGIGAQQGAILNQQNQGSSAVNNYNAQLMSPLGTMQRAEALNTVVGSQMPSYQGLGALHGITTGTPRNQTGLQAAGGILGQAASLYAGGAFGGIGGGGGGGGGGGLSQNQFGQLMNHGLQW